MSDFKIKHFSASHLMQLKNQEYQEAFDEILRTFVEEEITVEYVAEAFEDAKTENQKLVFLRNMKKKHPLTKTIRKQNDERYEYLTVITDTVKTALKSPFEEKRAAAKVLSEWLEPYRKSLSRSLLRVQTTLVKEISDEIDKLERVAEALITLDLVPVFNSIKLITEDIKSNITKRGKERSAERREAMIVKRRGYAKMMVFLKSIEMVLNLNGENKETYLAYAKETNELLDYYKTFLLSRSTRYKTAADKEEANATPPSNRAMTSAPYNLTSLFDEGMDMDMQTKEMTNEDSTTTDALTDNVTKNGNGVLTNKTNGASPADNSTAAHNGANKID